MIGRPAQLNCKHIQESEIKEKDKEKEKFLFNVITQHIARSSTAKWQKKKTKVSQESQNHTSIVSPR